jgi:hypothetical protein
MLSCYFMSYCWFIKLALVGNVVVGSLCCFYCYWFVALLILLLVCYIVSFVVGSIISNLSCCWSYYWFVMLLVESVCRIAIGSSCCYLCCWFISIHLNRVPPLVLLLVCHIIVVVISSLCCLCHGKILSIPIAFCKW